ncbi:flagellar assembly protein FliW [Desulfuribacillus alkaliarsenatis]|uniref:Flagellar assembly factor FliW n=1 Tax=Desulfuribacillus alkaliarsenatis TaxID=766136 RepID=A0A1E5G3V8_9FIRM|nr:flagellar assembly protein FliW [Desulfuribacillus alkaliarsenatis]OEF97709.1 hypothetical protein BHF68_14010 [Desulfuribacillus alkaliarsenatis]
MQIESTRLGTIEIDKDKIINFPSGIPGFQDDKQFVLVPMGEDNPFLFLQSVTDKNLCFILVEPHVFFNDYDIMLSEELVESLSIEKSEDVAIYTIVTIKDDLKKATTNLHAPLVVNAGKFLAKQYIISDGNYLTRQPLFPQEAMASKEVAVATEAAPAKED